MTQTTTLGESILVRSPNWLGDAVMVMPAVAQLLAQVRGKSKVSILAHPKLHEVWKLVEGVDAVLPVDKSLWKTAKSLRPHKFDSIIIFPNSLRTGLEAVLGGIPRRMGFRGHVRSLLLTTVVDRKIPREGIRHQSLDDLDLVKAAGVDVEGEVELPPFIRPPRPDIQGEYLAICPGAEYGPAKRWPAERFAEVAEAIAGKYGLKVVLLGAPVDEAVSKEVEGKMKSRPLNLTGKTSLAEFIQYLAHAKAALGNDSGSMHLAALLRVRGVVIFGSTEQRLTGPLSPKVLVVREHVPCSPCFLRECPIDFRCMTNISSARIIEKLEEVLKS